MTAHTDRPPIDVLLRLAEEAILNLDMWKMMELENVYGIHFDAQASSAAVAYWVVRQRADLLGLNRAWLIDRGYAHTIAGVRQGLAVFGFRIARGGR